MRIDLAHVAGRTFNTPLLMHRRRLDTALSAVGPRIIDGGAVGRSLDGDALRAALADRDASSGGSVRRYAGGGYLADHGIGVFPIVGTLVRRGSWLDAECGLMSYGLIRQGVDDMLADPSVRGVIAEYDTPGGEAGGCFDLARHMRAAAEAAGKPLWAHANELAASAGYALASAASRIWVSTTAEVGSIGVVAAHVDVSAADAKAGLKWTYIFEGDRKVDGNPHEPLSSEAEAAIRADVSSLYEMFVDIVAEQRRSLSAQRVRDLESETFRGALAVEAGLADQLGTLDDALEAFAAELEVTGGAKAQAPRQASVQPQRVAAAVEHVRVQAGQIMALANFAARHGVEIDAGALIAGGVSIQSARKSMFDRLAEQDEAVGEIYTCAPGSAAERNSRSGGVDKRDAWRKALRR